MRDDESPLGAGGLLPPGTGPASRHLMETLLRHGPLSRRELADRLTLSAPTLTRLCAPLLDAGLLYERGRSAAAVNRVQPSGRPRQPLDVRADAVRVVGVKLTGEDATAVLTGTHADVLDVCTTPLADRSPAGAVSTVAGLVATLVGAGRGADLLGLSLGGMVAEGGRVLRAPFLGWGEVPLGRLLSEATGLPTAVDNDLTALTRAEHWFGPFRAHDRFAVLTLGVGVGYGAVVHDRVVEGPDAGIGLLGHLPVGARGYRCVLGHEGCAHSVLALESVRRSVSDAVSAAALLTYDDCLHLAATHPAARRVLRDCGRGLGHLVGVVCNVLLTDRVVLTGEGVGLADAAPDAVRAGIAEVRDPLAAPVRLAMRPVDFGFYARGAAVSALQAWLGDRLSHGSEPAVREVEE